MVFITSQFGNCWESGMDRAAVIVQKI